MDGGIIVVKVTTGIHLIRDIGVHVSHDSPQFIPAEKVNSSKDLHTDLGAHILFRLDSPMPYKVAAPVVPEVRDPSPQIISAPPVRTAVEKENEQLKETLATMQKSMNSMEKMLADFIKSAPVQASGVAGAPLPQKSSEELVAIEVPMFIQDFTPQEVVGKIETTSETSDGGSIAGATSKLRALRKGGGK